MKLLRFIYAAGAVAVIAAAAALVLIDAALGCDTENSPLQTDPEC